MFMNQHRRFYPSTRALAENAPGRKAQPGLVLAVLLLSLAAGCADYCPPDSEDFFCRYVVSVRPPDAVRPELPDGPEALRTDPRYPN
jgi:hypothetical protein